MPKITITDDELGLAHEAVKVALDSLGRQLHDATTKQKQRELGDLTRRLRGLASRLPPP